MFDAIFGYLALCVSLRITWLIGTEIRHYGALPVLFFSLFVAVGYLVCYQTFSEKRISERSFRW